MRILKPVTLLLTLLCASGAFAQPNVTQAISLPIPLAQHEQGQQMMSEAVKNSALANLQWKFLDKTYENHVYARDPFGNNTRCRA